MIYVYSNDVWQSAIYAVDQDLAPVLTMSYGTCEQSDLVDLASRDQRGGMRQRVSRLFSFLGNLIPQDGSIGGVTRFLQHLSEPYPEIIVNGLIWRA